MERSTYIDEVELSYLYNYNGEDREDFKLKNLFSKKGRQEIRDDISEKHPKLGKVLDSKAFKVLSKVALIGGGIALAGPALAALGSTYVAGGAATGSAKTLTGFKPAMQAVLKKKGIKTNGLPLKDVVKKFLKAKGEKSTNAADDLTKVARLFQGVREKKMEGTANEEESFLSDLIEGTANRIAKEGEGLIEKMITGEDAATDTPPAPKEPEKPAEKPASTDPEKPTTDPEKPEGGKMNIALIAGAAIVLYFLAKRN